jgi:hypothetical protein
MSGQRLTPVPIIPSRQIDHASFTVPLALLSFKKKTRVLSWKCEVEYRAAGISSVNGLR